MKTQACLVLSLSAILSLTALAQNNSTPSSSSSAPQTSSDSDREPLQQPRASGFWDNDDPNLVNLIVHPFASKKYVLRHTVPIRDRVNELDELTTDNSAKIKDIDARSTQGIKLASEKANVADQHATDASNKAQMAQTAATEASTRVSSVEQKVGGLDQYTGNAQTEIRFRPGQTMLSKNAKDALDQMAEPLNGQRSFIIEVRGFSSGHGQTAIANSQKMADSVERYLVLTHKIPAYRIYVTSMGNATTTGEGTAARHSTGGRVEISVLQNGASTAQK